MKCLMICTAWLCGYQSWRFQVTPGSVHMLSIQTPWSFSLPPRKGFYSSHSTQTSGQGNKDFQAPQSIAQRKLMLPVSWGGVHLDRLKSGLLFLPCTALACYAYPGEPASQKELGEGLCHFPRKHTWDWNDLSQTFCVECLSAVTWPGIFTVLGSVNFPFLKSVSVKFYFAIIYLFHLKYRHQSLANIILPV